MAPYDGLRQDVTGVRVPGAVNDASSVAIILEALQTLVEGDFQPKRSILVVFYASQAMPSGMTRPYLPNVRDLLNVKTGFAFLKPQAVIVLQAAGGGDGSRLVIGGGGEMRLTQLVERAARLHHVPTLRDLDPIDIGAAFGASSSGMGTEYPTIILGWQGGRDLAGLPEDDLAALSPQAMDDVGHVLTLLLGLIAREPVY
jgi:acetylornithine deacetylase/succinyl-diaminopimelate desuccinylase-like protein